MAERLQSDPETRAIPIVFLTARSRPIDLARGLVQSPTSPSRSIHSSSAPRIRELLKLEPSEREDRRRARLSELRRALS